MTPKPRPTRPTQYSASIIRSDGRGETRIFQDGDWKRVELKRPNGAMQVTIYRPDLGAAFMLDPSSGACTRTAMDRDTIAQALEAKEDSETWTWTGEELVDGVRCDRYDVVPRPGVPPKLVFVDGTIGLNRRVVTRRRDGSVALQIDWLEVTVGPQPRELFEPPSADDERA
jgi:hypothetical protein